MARHPSTFGATMDRMSVHSARSVLTRGKTDDSEEIHGSESRIDIPKDLLPYLNRLGTQDIMNYLNNEGDQSLEIKGYRKKFAWRVLRMHHFDSFMGLVIVLNLIVMIIEIDRSANLEESPAVRFHWTEIVGLGVLVIFLLELFLRLVLLQCMFFKDAWNVFDFVVLSLDTVFSVVGLVAASTFPVSVLRICRVAKLARVFKVLRVFPELRLLLAGLISSASAIFWGALLLFFFMLLWASVAVLIIHPLNASIEYSNCERCPHAYSSVMHAVLTFWQSIVAGDSWGTVTIPVMEKYPSTAIFFIAVYLSVGMAVTNLILGVVVNVAQQAVASLEEEDRFTQAFEQWGKQTQLLEICKDMDSDGNGELSQEELYAAFESEGEFRDTIDALGISKEDFGIAWSILDGNKDGAVSYKELVTRLSSLKTSDSEYMLNYIKCNMKELKAALMQKLDSQHAETLALDRRLESSRGVVHGEARSDFHDMAEEVSQAKVKTANNISPDRGTETHTRECVTSSSKDKIPTVLEFTSLHNDIEMVRMELKGILMDMERKLDQQYSNLSAKNSPIASMNTQSDLLVLPSKESVHICRPQCREARDGTQASFHIFGHQSCEAPARDRAKETVHVFRPQCCEVPSQERCAIDVPAGSALGLVRDGSTKVTSTLWRHPE